MDWPKGPSGMDPQMQGNGSEACQEDSPLGMEARSILRSIETEEQKLLQSKNITRSDRHYFRARYNYYKLCLIRLEKEERAILEPALMRFLSHITEMDAGIPFLEPVPNPRAESLKAPAVGAPQVHSPQAVVKSTEEAHRPVVAQNSPLVSQLKMIRVGLKADLSADERQVLIEALDRIIQQLNGAG